MTVLQVTLSRAHKLAERLKNGSTELFAQAVALAQPKQLQHAVALAQTGSLQAQGEQALAMLADAERWALALAGVRDTIGKENVTRGISTKLAQLEGFNRVLAQKKLVLQAFKADALSPAEIAAIPAQPAPNGYSPGLNCRVLPAAGESQLAADVEALQKKIFLWTDEIAEANASRASFELPDDIASKISGA